MRKNKRAGIANLFEIIGASLFLLVLFLVFCSGLFLEFDKMNVVIKGNTAGYNYDITMQNYLRSPVEYNNETITMLDLINIAIDTHDYTYLETKTKEMLVQYTYESKFWYIGVWDMHPNDFNKVLNEYVDYSDFKSIMKKDPGHKIESSELLVNLHQLKPKDKGENKELRYTQIPYFNSKDKKFMILVFQIGEAK